MNQRSISTERFNPTDQLGVDYFIVSSIFRGRSQMQARVVAPAISSKQMRVTVELPLYSI